MFIFFPEPHVQGEFLGIFFFSRIGALFSISVFFSATIFTLKRNFTVSLILISKLSNNSNALF